MDQKLMEQQMRKAMENLGIHGAKITWYGVPKFGCQIEIPDEHELVRIIVEKDGLSYKVILCNCMSFVSRHMDFGCCFADGLAFVIKLRTRRILQEVT